MFQPSRNVPPNQTPPKETLRSACKQRLLQLKKNVLHLSLPPFAPPVQRILLFSPNTLNCSRPPPTQAHKSKKKNERTVLRGNSCSYVLLADPNLRRPFSTLCCACSVPDNALKALESKKYRRARDPFFPRIDAAHRQLRSSWGSSL